MRASIRFIDGHVLLKTTVYEATLKPPSVDLLQEADMIHVINFAAVRFELLPVKEKLY